MAFCSDGFAKGKINNHVGAGRDRASILGNEIPIWREVTQSLYILCLAVFLFWNAGKGGHGGKGCGEPPQGMRKTVPKGYCGPMSGPQRSQAGTCYCIKFSSWENSEPEHQGS